MFPKKELINPILQSPIHYKTHEINVPSIRISIPVDIHSADVNED